MLGPNVTIHLDIIERNTRTVVAACRKAGIAIFGVTKGTCGMPQVARAMLRGGVIGIGESRFENIRRLRASGIDCPIVLLRSPPRSHIEEVITSVDISLNSELAIIEELSRVAERMGRIHELLLMLDLGDLREGIWPDDLAPTVEKVLDLVGVRIVGIGTNLTCFGAILPSEENMGTLVEHARSLDRTYGLQLRYVSGGNSSSLPLLLSGKMPLGINNLRIGEAILQGGRDTFLDEPWRELDQDAFLLTGELLEVKLKPSLPIGQMGVDAFGKRPVFEDRGSRLRGILNIGREDIIVEGLTPTDAGVEVLGASSDHLVLDLSKLHPPPEVGDTLGFHMDYGALLTAMTSEYVVKKPMFDKGNQKKATKVSLLVETALLPLVRDADLVNRFASLDLEADVCGVEELAAALAKESVPLLLGADHSISLNGMSALSNSVDAFGLLWFDATASFKPTSANDRHAPAETVLYRALGYDPDSTSLKPQLSPENVVLIGLRDVAPVETRFIKESGITVFTIEDVDAVGIREIIRQALHTVLAGTRGFYVSYNPAVTDIPATVGGSGGITPRETHQAMEAIARSGQMLAMEVVGLSPDQTSRINTETLGFVMSCFGKRIL